MASARLSRDDIKQMGTSEGCEALSDQALWSAAGAWPAAWRRETSPTKRTIGMEMKGG